MKVLIAGSHGMVGSTVTDYLLKEGHHITRLVRQTPRPDEIWWDADAGKIDTARLEGFDGVIQLASMPWPMRWASKFKQTMRANRLQANRLLAESLAECKRKPQVLICASGMGYYPSSGEELLTEDSLAGASFLAHLQRDGEATTVAAREAGIRVIHLRIPPVLAKTSIAQANSQIGDGRQWMSWVGRDELAAIIAFALENDSLVGPVNAVSPNPMRNADAAALIARTLGRKPGPTLPAFLVHLLMGEMGDEFMLASRRIVPAKLLAAGYSFRFPQLEQAVRHEMEK